METAMEIGFFKTRTFHGMKGIEEGELDIIQQIHISGISISNWTHFI